MVMVMVVVRVHPRVFPVRVSLASKVKGKSEMQKLRGP